MNDDESANGTGTSRSLGKNHIRLNVTCDLDIQGKRWY
jgi:hypothetical protein